MQTVTLLIFNYYLRKAVAVVLSYNMYLFFFRKLEDMSDTNEDVQGMMEIALPVKVSYSALRTILKEKMVGEMIKKESDDGESSNYAQILDVNISKSELPEFDLILEIEFQTLTSIFRNKRGTAYFHSALELDRKKQSISISEFNVRTETHSWLADTLLQTLLNRWMHAKLKKKMHFNFLPMIEKQIISLNKKLEQQIEAKEGVHISGNLDNLEIIKIRAREAFLEIFVKIEGSAEVEVKDLSFATE